MAYQFTVTAEVQKTSGKFASRDSVETELIEAIESADPGSISPDDSEYDVISWDVSPGVEVEDKTKTKAAPDARNLRDIPEIRALLTVWRVTAGKSDAETMEAFKVPMQNLLVLLGM